MFLDFCRHILPFRGGSDGKESTCNTGDPGSIPGPGRSPGEGNGYPLQYSCLGNPMVRRVWWATVHGVTKNWTWLSNTTLALGRSDGEKFLFPMVFPLQRSEVVLSCQGPSLACWDLAFCVGVPSSGTTTGILIPLWPCSLPQVSVSTSTGSPVGQTAPAALHAG